MITDLETKLSCRHPTGWKKKQWCGLILAPVISLAMGSHVQAQQQVRSIQAPAPYNACNLRSGGGTQYSVLGTFRNGSSVTLLGEAGRGWYRVQVGQQIGWLARQCLGL